MRARKRLLVLLLLVGLGVGLFYQGRQHQVFLDNKTLEVAGTTCRALKLVRVSVDGLPSIELMPRDRDLVQVVGPRFALTVEVMDEFGEAVESSFDLHLSPGFTKDFMISLPLLAAGRDDYLLPPPSTASQAEAANEAKSPDEIVPEAEKLVTQP